MSNRRLLSQLDDFAQAFNIGIALSNRRDNITVNEGTPEQELTVGDSDGGQAVNENAVNVKTLERCFNEKIDREMCNIVDTVEDRNQNATRTVIDSMNAPKIELAVRLTNASSGRDAASVMASSELGENIGVTASFENVSERNSTLHMLNTYDETRNKLPDEASELSVPDTHFDRQPHTLITKARK